MSAKSKSWASMVAGKEDSGNVPFAAEESAKESGLKRLPSRSITK